MFALMYLVLCEVSEVSDFVPLGKVDDADEDIPFPDYHSS